MSILSCLIVDDSSVTRSQLRAGILDILPNTHVFEAEHALEAARFLKRSMPDVVFLDLNMPAIGGIEFLDRLDKVIGKTKKPTVVSITADISARTLEALRSRGAYDLLPKPFDKVGIAVVLLRIMQLSRSRRVLIVDDSATVRSVVRKIVQRSRFKLETEEAETADQAVRLFSETAFDLAFIDMYMPGVDGLAAAGDILYDHQGADVVMMSGRPDENVRRAASHIGVKHFLKKPFFPADVDAILHGIYGLPDTRFLEAAKAERFSQIDSRFFTRSA